TTMHHDGFRLYDTKLTDFNSVKSCGRDLTAEIVEAARTRNLKIGLYHSLNNWMDQPDGVAALEREMDYHTYIHNTFERIRELVEKFNPIDILWYDAPWPFDAERWQAEKMDAMVRSIQPQILINGRNGLPGDFATPEGHVAYPDPWRPWEACLTLNNSWGYNAGDEDWKSANQVLDLLAMCATGNGNLLLNIGPRGDGSVPDGSTRVLEEVGDWLRKNGEAIYDVEPFINGENGRGDFCSHGHFTAKDNNLYVLVRRWPGEVLTIAGLKCKVLHARLLGSEKEYSFHQRNGRVQVIGLPPNAPGHCSVLRLECDKPPSMYLCGGMTTPHMPHPHY
ncbi:MAG: alpha-L-fucosidase, partial [Abditibacteriaceae bacterium]